MFQKIRKYIYFNTFIIYRRAVFNVDKNNNYIFDTF